MSGAAAARELLVRLASEVGFPAPAPAQGLAAWADGALDATLTRGSAAWASAHGHVLAALEAAILGSESGIRAALARARDEACAAGSTAPCRCPPGAAGHRVTVGPRQVCVKCGGRALRRQ